MNIRPNKRRFAIGFYLLAGFSPWGVDLEGRLGKAEPTMPNCGGGDWIMCCGHVLKTGEVENWTRAGLAADGPPDRFGRPTIVAGPALDRWISDAWHDLQVRSWSR